MGRLIGGLCLGALIAVLFGILVEHLWNWLMPVLFHLPSVSFWQAVGLVFLSRLLFGHVGGGRGWHRHHHHKRKHWCGPGGKWGGRGWKKHDRHGDDDAPWGRAFAPGGDTANWEHFDAWWKRDGEAQFEAFVGHGNRGWGWWKWWKTEGRAQFETWLKDRKPD